MHGATGLPVRIAGPVREPGKPFAGALEVVGVNLPPAGATELDAAPMSLYRHVNGKDELLMS